MATNKIDLPEGFVLDTPQVNNISLPEGFVLDTPGVGQLQPKEPGVIEKAVTPVTDYLLPQWLTEAKFEPGKYNIYGDVSERISGALRAAVLYPKKQPKGLEGSLDIDKIKQGFLQPQTIPTFQEKMGSDVGGAILGFSADALNNVWNLVLPGIAKGIAKEMPVVANVISKNMGLIKSNPAIEGLSGEISKAISNIKINPIKAFTTFSNKSKASYLTDDVAPIAENIFKEKVSNFTPEIQSFARKNKIPESAIQDIKVKGTDKILQRATELGNNPDTIYQRIEQGFANKEKLANDAYNLAVRSEPTGYGGKINIGNTEDEMVSILKKQGMLRTNGKPTDLALSKAMENSQSKKLLDIQQSLKLRTTAPEGEILTSPQMKRYLRTGVKREDLAREIPLNKEQYMLLRDNLNALYKETPYDRNIARIMDVFYTDGENSGLKGLQNARKLQREHFQAMDKFINKTTGQIKGFGERNLEKFYNYTGEQKRGLQEIADYIGDKTLLSDLGDLNASKYIENLTKDLDKKYFQRVLNEAMDRSKTNAVQQELGNILGQKEAQELIKEVKTHRKFRIGYRIGQGAGLVGTEEIIRRNIPR